MPVESLRVGILCNGTIFQRWQAECIRQVMAVPGVDVVVLVVNLPVRQAGEVPPAAPRTAWQRFRDRHWGTALYRAYRERWNVPDALRMEDLGDDLTNVPRIPCRAEAKGPAQYIAQADLERIRATRPDVLLRFGFNILKGPILELPRHGVWSYHHGDEMKFRGGPPGLWEIMHGDPVTGAILQRLTEKLDAGRVLYKGWFSTVDHSLKETVDTVMMQSSGWAAQVCRAIVSGDAAAAEGVQSATDAPIHKYPRNLDFLLFLRRMFNNKLRFHRSELKQHEEWNFGVLYQPIHTLLEEKPNLNVRWLPAPASTAFRADPFGYLDAEGQLNVLYEKYDRLTGLGEISRIRPKRDNILKRSRTLLNLPTHLSYPYVVEHEGKVYVVPENAAGGGVDIYRLNTDSDAMELVRRILDVPLFDPTVFQHEGRWWLLGSVAPLTNVHLVAYHAPALFGPYTPHALNPIKTDIRSARPAGTPFVHEGQLYRPGQDSSYTYGHRVVIHKVLALTPTSFKEEAFRTLGPIQGSAWNKGVHTISAVGGFTLVDGKRYVHSPEQEKRIRKRKLTRLQNGSA